MATVGKGVRITIALAVTAILAAVLMSRISAQKAPAWKNQDANWAAAKEELRVYGARFQTSDALYEALKESAGGGKPLTWQQLSEPAYDWSGIYTRAKGGLQYDPDLPADALPTSARLTQAGQAVLD